MGQLGQLVASRGLPFQTRVEIRNLEAVCYAIEQLTLKLNWDMLDNRPLDELNDFLYYENEELVGFLGLYALGGQIEITGMVHPNHRRKGIFSQLFSKAMQECKSRGVERVLFITERHGIAGQEFAKSAGWSYVFSEYRMKLDVPVNRDIPNHGITLRRAQPGDFSELFRLDEVGFGASTVLDESGEAPPFYHSTYIAELEERFLGKIGVTMEGQSSYIFGFVIKPEVRGCGYGREVLQLTIERLSAEGKLPVILEVAVENEKALKLYQSCGFETVTVYDYYEVNPKKGE